MALHFTFQQIAHYFTLKKRKQKKRKKLKKERKNTLKANQTYR